MELVYETVWYVDKMTGLTLWGAGFSGMMFSAFYRSVVMRVLNFTVFLGLMCWSMLSILMPVDDPNLIYQQEGLPRFVSSDVVIPQLEDGYGITVVNMGAGDLVAGEDVDVVVERDEGLKELCSLFPESKASNDGRQKVDLFCGDQLVKPRM